MNSDDNRAKPLRKRMLSYVGGILCVLSLIATVQTLSSPLGMPPSGLLLLIAFIGIGILGYLVILESNGPVDE